MAKFLGNSGSSSQTIPREVFRQPWLIFFQSFLIKKKITAHSQYLWSQKIKFSPGIQLIEIKKTDFKPNVQYFEIKQIHFKPSIMPLYGENIKKKRLWIFKFRKWINHILYFSNK